MLATPIIIYVSWKLHRHRRLRKPLLSTKLFSFSTFSCARRRTMPTYFKCDKNRKQTPKQHIELELDSVVCVWLMCASDINTIDGSYVRRRLRCVVQPPPMPTSKRPVTTRQLNGKEQANVTISLLPTSDELHTEIVASTPPSPRSHHNSPKNIFYPHCKCSRVCLLARTIPTWIEFCVRRMRILWALNMNGQA